MKPDVEHALRTLLDAARGAASAYEAAQQKGMPEQDARWLRQGTDENEQNVRLLVPHVESLLGAKKPTWFAALLEGGKAKVGSWLGLAEMMGALQKSEEKLVDALDAVLALPSLPVELKALCEDQQASAKTRLSHLRQRQASVQHGARDDQAGHGHGRQGHTADTINKPRAASSEQSDC